MKKWSRLLATVLLLLPAMGEGIPWPPHAVISGSSSSGDRDRAMSKEGDDDNDSLVEIYPTGSSLPDCSHACGPCFPCRRVMVSFECSAVAESCPIVYRCMCRGRYYHVPSI